jgi:hypothetical protein
MSIFNRSRTTDKRAAAEATKADKRASLASFKANADAASIKDSIHKITGGTLADCHKPGMVA